MTLDIDSPDQAMARAALTVSALNRAVARSLERNFPLVRVRGEIANLTRAGSGHWYFALKDEQAQVKCVMFRTRNLLLDWTPRDGDDVEINAIVSLYEARGEFQLSVEFIRRTGQGRLFEEFLRLKSRLAGEGLFGRERKRTLPAVPRRVAIVTSMRAAALADVVTTLCRRAPYVGVVICPVPVQGNGAGAQIAAMLNRVSARAESDAVDVVLLVRGGGSIEDLWAFNEEDVARAIIACTIPVVVGVGHESDITIADFAADLRAPTPTAAAELVAPSAAELTTAFDAQRSALLRGLRRALDEALQRVDYAARFLWGRDAPWRVQQAQLKELQMRSGHVLAAAQLRARDRLGLSIRRLLVARPSTAGASARVEALLEARRSAIAVRLQREQVRVETGIATLAHLDPAHILARGFSVVRHASGALVRDSRDVGIGAVLDIEFAHGGASARVEQARR